MLDLPQNINNLPKDVKDVIEVHKSLEELYDERGYYEKRDSLGVSERVDRLYEYRSKLFSILKKTQSIKSSGFEFEIIRDEVVTLITNILSWTEKNLIVLIGYPDIPSEEGYQEICMKYVIENAFLFYKLRVSDDYSGFMNRWNRVVDNITKNHIDADRKNDHTRFLSGNDYEISLEDLEYLIGKYVIRDIKKCLQNECSRFISDKKEIESRRKGIVSELKEKYPNATGNCKSFLLSVRNWNALFEDFLKEEQKSILTRIKESKILENSNPINSIVLISVFLNSYLNPGYLDKKFEDYIFMRTENEFIKAEQKNKPELIKPKKIKSNNTQPIIESKTTSQKRDLPTGMEDEIKKLDIINDRQLIRFFRVELTNFGGHIKMSHLKDRLNRMSEIDYLPDILALLDNYPEFIIEEDEKPETKDKIPLNGDSEEVELEKESSIKEPLLNKLSEVSDKSDIEERLSGYISIFEDLGFRFKDKEDFLRQLKDAVNKTYKDCLEKSIQIALKFRIFGNGCLSKKWGGFGYHAIYLNYKARRIVLTNMQITHIVSHDEYLKLINTKPS